MTRLRKLIVTFSLCVLAACQHPIVDPGFINEPLGGPSSAGKESCVGFGASTEVCLRSGMKLEITASDAYSGGFNSRTPVLSQSEWLIPTDATFTQEDMFRLSQLLSGAQSSSFNAPICLKEWLIRATSREDFIARFAAPLLASLRVDYEPYNQVGGDKTATHVQGWAAKLPAALNSSNPNPRQAVRFDFPYLANTVAPTGPAAVSCYAAPSTPPISLTALYGGSVFELADDATLSTQVKNDWSRHEDGMDWSRTFVTVMVPVRVAGEPGRRYYPFYYSLCDVERALGAPIRAVRRDRQLAPGSAAPTNGPVHLVFWTSGLYFGTALPVLATLKPELLVAPHDEYLLGANVSACTAAPAMAIP